jgi:hypothetical protein
MIVGLYNPLEKPAFMIVNRWHGQDKYEEFKAEVSDLFNGAVLGLKCFCDEAEEIGNKIITLEEPSHPLSESIRKLAHDIEEAT